MITTTALRQLPILIFISFDGFRHDYLSPTLTPNLFELSKTATLGHMESSFITKTFPNHFSMATGLYEDVHEMVNNKMFDPRLNATFMVNVTDPDWWDFYRKTIPIWTANELFGEHKFNHHRRHSASMMFPGSSTPYKGILPTHLQDYSKKSNFTDNIETVIDWLTDPIQPANLLTMYFDEPDSTAHFHGPWGQPTLDAVRRIDDATGYLMNRLNDVGLVDKTNIIFVSDHGMAEVKNVVYLSEVMDTSGIELYGNSPDWSVFVKPERRHQKTKIFRELVTNAKKYHYRVYKRSDIPPELHYSKSVRIGDFFILADENYDLFLERPRQAKKLPEVWGNHGWLPNNRDMRPLFMARGPSFKRDYNHADAFPNIDLFPLMTFLLGLPMEKLPNNGSLARIIDIVNLEAHNDQLGATVRRKYLFEFENSNHY